MQAKFILILLTFLNCFPAIVYAEAKEASKHKKESSDIKQDLRQWNYTTKLKDSDEGYDKAGKNRESYSYFEEKRRATEIHIRQVQELNKFIQHYVAERQVETINSRLYNVGAKGEPAPSEPDLELFETHTKLFCSPLSGYETAIFKECSRSTPLVLQHADLKPMVLDKPRLTAERIPIVRNWIDNFLTSLVHSNLPNYIKDPDLMADANYRDQYVNRLRNQIPIATAANTLNMMLAKRIPLDAKNEDSPSIASSLVEEISGRHLNTNWQEAVRSSTDGVDINREQLRVLALISYQINELNDRLERVELLNAALVTNLSNQQEILAEMLKTYKSTNKK